MHLLEYQKYMRKKGLGATILLNLNSLSFNPNLYYFAGYGGVGACVVPLRGPPYLIIPKMEAGRTRSIRAIVLPKKKRVIGLIAQKIRSKKIGIDYTSISLSALKLLKGEFKARKFIDISAELLRQRSIKTKSEIEKIKKSCQLADSILLKTIKKIKLLKKEGTVAAFIENEIKKIGCKVAFPPIVASGSNSSIPHHSPENKALRKGFCIIDFGVRYQNYCSDITRTIYLGNPSKKEADTYNYLLEKQKKIVSQLKKDLTGGEIYTKLCESIGANAKYFTHGLGHGIGLDVHELPNLTLGAKDKLSQNSIFTVEPGLYFPKKFGMRIEDDILLSRKGPIYLTKAPKDLITIN